MSSATATLLPSPAPRQYGEAKTQRSLNQYLLWSLPADAVAPPGTQGYPTEAVASVSRGDGSGCCGATTMSSATATLLPSPAPRQYGEASLQRAVHQYLSWALPADAVHFAIPNGLMRSKKAAARAQGEGVAAGVPDLAVVHRGRALFVELKSARGVVSPAQREMIRKLTYCGAPVMLCRSVPEVEAQLREACVPLRASVAA